MTKKITEDQAKNIIDEYLAGNKSGDIAKKFNISKSQIKRIVHGECFKYLDRPSNIDEIMKKRCGNPPGWAKGKYDLLPIITDVQSDIIVGSLLGDATITKRKSRRRECRFVKSQCIKFKEYLDWTHEQLMPYSCNVCELNNSAYAFGTCSHPIFSNMRDEWYPLGKKIVPRNIKISPLTIAVWFCDDGSNYVSGRQCTICTHCFSFDDVEFLASEIAKFGPNANICKCTSKYTGEKQPILQFSGNNYDKFIDFIKPLVIWKCFEYKTAWRQPKTGIYGDLRKNVKLSSNKIKLAIELKKKGLSWDAIADQFGVSDSTIFSACTGKNFKNLDIQRLQKGQYSARDKVDETQVREIRELYHNGILTKKELAVKYNITENQIYHIVTNRSRKNIN